MPGASAGRTMPWAPCPGVLTAMGSRNFTFVLSAYILLLYMCSFLREAFAGRMWSIPNVSPKERHSPVRAGCLSSLSVQCPDGCHTVNGHERFID